ncbi:unnamed protein product [Effrenium voratum]|nr:unnamed protein product [Effrenium voratum]
MVPLVPESSELKRGIEVAGLPRQVIGGYQATVKFFCLDGEWENAVFVGEVRPDKAIAEHSAAAVAFAELQKDVVLRARAAAPNPNKSKKASQWTWKPPNPAAVPRADLSRRWCLPGAGTSPWTTRGEKCGCFGPAPVEHGKSWETICMRPAETCSCEMRWLELDVLNC